MNNHKDSVPDFKPVQFHRTRQWEVLNERAGRWAERKKQSKSIPNYVMEASDSYEKLQEAEANQ